MTPKSFTGCPQICGKKNKLPAFLLCHMEVSHHSASPAARKMHINGKRWQISCWGQEAVQSSQQNPLIRAPSCIIFYFCALLFLEPLSRWLQTFCITPVLAKNRTVNATSPLPRSFLCGLYSKPMSFHSLPQSLCITPQRAEPPHFPLQQKHTLRGAILHHSRHTQTTEMFYFSAALPLEDYVNGITLQLLPPLVF